MAALVLSMIASNAIKQAKVLAMFTLSKYEFNLYVSSLYLHRLARMCNAVSDEAVIK